MTKRWCLIPTSAVMGLLFSCQKGGTETALVQSAVAQEGSGCDSQIRERLGRVGAVCQEILDDATALEKQVALKSLCDDAILLLSARDGAGAPLNFRCPEVESAGAFESLFAEVKSAAATESLQNSLSMWLNIVRKSAGK